VTIERPTFTEQDVEDLLKNERFLASVHAYSLDRFPLGEAVVRARAGAPFVPPTLTGQAYERLIQEVAERIYRLEIEVPKTLSARLPELYAEYVGPSYKRGAYTGRGNLRFSDLLNPEVKKNAFASSRASFTEHDIEELLRDQKLLACVDGYGRNLMTFGAAQLLMFGNNTFVPFDLSWDAFHRLCVEVVDRIRSGKIKIPDDFLEKFPEVYISR
jgi:hypothetical protein